MRKLLHVFIGALGAVFGTLIVIALLLGIICRQANAQTDGTSTQKVLPILCTSAVPTVIVSTSTSMTSGVLNLPIDDFNTALFAGSNLANRSGSGVAPDNANLYFVVAGTKGAQLATDGNYHSRTMQANTAHFWQANCNGTILPASGQYFTFNTSTIPADDTRAELLPADSSGNVLVPTIADTRNADYTDPITGAQIRNIYVSTDYNVPNLGSGANLNICAAVLTGPTSGPDSGQLGWNCIFQTDNGSQSLYWVRQSDRNVRFLGIERGSTLPNFCDAPSGQSAILDDLHPNNIYITENYVVSGGCSGVLASALIRGQYTDTAYTPAVAGANCSCTWTLLTPLGHLIPDLIHVFNSTYDTSIFNSVSVYPLAGYALLVSQRSIQGSYGWYAILRLGDGEPIGSCSDCMSVTAATFAPTNTIIKWVGTHSQATLPGFFQLVPGYQEGCSSFSIGSVNTSYTAGSGTIILNKNDQTSNSIQIVVGRYFSVLGEAGNTTEWFLVNSVSGSGPYTVSVTGAQFSTAPSNHSSNAVANIKSCDPIMYPEPAGLGPYGSQLTQNLTTSTTTFSIQTPNHSSPDDGTPASLSDFVNEVTLPNPAGGKVGFQTGDQVLFCGGTTLAAAVTTTTQTAWTLTAAIPNLQNDPGGSGRLYAYGTAGIEAVNVSAGASGTSITVTRGSQASTPRTFPSGTHIVQDYNACRTNEHATVVSVASNSLTVTRDLPSSSGASAWPSGSWVYGVGMRQTDGQIHYPIWVANTGDPTFSSLLIEHNNDFVGNHEDFSASWNVAEAGYHGRYGVPISSVVSQPTTVTSSVDQAFNNTSGLADGNIASRYPVVLRPLDPNQNSFYDMSGYIGGIPGSSVPGASLISGQLYKYIPCTSTNVPVANCQPGMWPLQRKFIPTMTVSGAGQVLTDVSGPSCSIGTTSSDSWKYGVAAAANECVSGSSVGDIYFNIPGLTDLACLNNETGAHKTGGIPTVDACIQDSNISYANVVKFSLTPNLDGYGQKLSSMLAGPRPNRELMKPTPDGALGFFRSQPTKMFMLTMPPIPVRDGFDRSSYIPHNVQVPPVNMAMPGSASTVTVSFGYAENGGYCTSRQESCISVTSGFVPATPFSFVSTDTYTKLSCASGCTVTVPLLANRIAYLTINYYNAGGTLLRSDALPPEAIAPAGFVLPAGCSIVPTTISGGTVGIAYNTNLIASNCGVSILTWSISAGALLPGLALNTSTGAITGTPTTSATYSFTVKVTDGASNTASQPYTVNIAAAAGCSITPSSLPSGTVGTAYSQTLSTSSCGAGPFTWSISSGSLPTSLSLGSSTGIISGTPTVANTFAFTIGVTDGGSNTASQAYSVVIAVTGTHISLIPSGTIAISGKLGGR